MRKLTTLLTITLVIIILAGCADKPHEHTFHDKWEFDDTNHWHKATCGHDEISGMAEHIFINSSDCTKTESIYKCQVCEYTKTVTERGRHSFGEDDICTVCGGYRCGDNVAAIFDSSNKTLTLRGTGDMFGYTDSDVRKWADLKFEALIVEDGVTSIGKESFKSLDFKSVKIGKDVKKIGSYAFAYTKETETIEFDVNSTLDEIGSYAFKESGLKSVTLPSSLRILGWSSFNQCISLSSLVLNEGIREIKGSAIYYTAITELNLPSTYNLLMLTKNVLILLSNFVPFSKRDLFLSISLRLMISLL